MELTPADAAGLRIIRKWGAMQVLRRLGAGRALAKPSREAVDAAAAVGLLTIDGSSPERWFAGGRAMQRVWLAASACDLAAQPLTAICYLFARLEEGGEGLRPRETRRLRALRARYLSLFEVPVGHAELMLLRFAYAPPPSARSLRRRVEDVLDFA